MIRDLSISFPVRGLYLQNNALSLHNMSRAFTRVDAEKCPTRQDAAAAAIHLDVG